MEIFALLSFALSIALIFTSVKGIINALKQPETSFHKDQQLHTLRELNIRKQILMNQIKTAQLDFQTEKISPEDHTKTVHLLEQNLVQVMRKKKLLLGKKEDIERGIKLAEEYTKKLANK